MIGEIATDCNLTVASFRPRPLLTREKKMTDEDKDLLWSLMPEWAKSPKKDQPSIFYGTQSYEGDMKIHNRLLLILGDPDPEVRKAEKTRALIERLCAERDYLRGMVKDFKASGSLNAFNAEIRLEVVEAELANLLATKEKGNGQGS